jgi:hypothetical protein
MGKRIKNKNNHPDEIYNNHINGILKTQAPEFAPLQVTGCDPTLFNQVQNAIDCGCMEGGMTGSLCDSLHAGKVASTIPFSCMIDVISNKSCCNQRYSKDIEKAAFQAFSDVTGYKPVNFDEVFNTLHSQNVNLIHYNAFFTLMPVFILILITIWLMVGFKWINWVVGLFATTFTIVVLYAFAISYRITGQNYINNNASNIKQNLEKSQQNFEDSVAYWAQGLFAAACAISSNGGLGSWTCNNCNLGSNLTSCVGCVQAETIQE